MLLYKKNHQRRFRELSLSCSVIIHKYSTTDGRTDWQTQRLMIPARKQTQYSYHILLPQNPQQSFLLVRAHGHQLSHWKDCAYFPSRILNNPYAIYSSELSHRTSLTGKLQVSSAGRYFHTVWTVDNVGKSSRESAAFSLLSLQATLYSITTRVMYVIAARNCYTDSEQTSNWHFLTPDVVNLVITSFFPPLFFCPDRLNMCWYLDTRDRNCHL